VCCRWIRSELLRKKGISKMHRQTSEGVENSGAVRGVALFDLPKRGEPTARTYLVFQDGAGDTAACKCPREDRQTSKQRKGGGKREVKLIRSGRRKAVKIVLPLSFSRKKMERLEKRATGSNFRSKENFREGSGRHHAKTLSSRNYF